MLSAPIHIHAQPGSKHMRLPLSLSLGSALLIAFAVIFGSFHHHNDLKAHPECAICAVAYHVAAETTAPPTLARPLPALFDLIAIPVLTVPFKRPIAAFISRAPPR
jgi:hypothetical protein